MPYDVWVEVVRVFREYQVLRERPKPAGGGFTPRVQFRRSNLKKMIQFWQSFFWPSTDYVMQIVIRRWQEDCFNMKQGFFAAV